MNQQKLPDELIDIILEYAGIVKMRAGKYMRQIDVKGAKYETLINIKKIKCRDLYDYSFEIPRRHWYISLPLPNEKYGYELMYDNHYSFMCVLYCESFGVILYQA